MDTNMETQIMQAIYNYISNAISYDPKGKSCIANTNTTVVQIVPNGIAIDSNAFANLVSPTNLNGSYLSSEMFANLIDAVPELGTEYCITTRSIDEIYGEIVTYASTNGKQESSSVVGILEKAQEEYCQSKLTSQIPGGSSWHLSYTIPTNWADSSAVNLYNPINISTEDLTTNSQSQILNNGFNYGLWNKENPLGKLQNNIQEHTGASSITINAEICIVEIKRPWLEGSIFNMGGWNMGNAYAKGAFSSGDIATSALSIMPLIPISFVAAKNIKITGNWSTQDQSNIQEAISGSKSIGWGPFCLSGNYANNKENEFKSSYQDGTITIPETQIIAFISQILPLCPPE